MKYPANTYAKAFIEALAAAKGDDGEKVIGERFLAVVRGYGDEASLPKILNEADRLMRMRNGTRKLVVTSARGLDAKAQSLIGSLIQPGDAVEEKIDPALVAGIKITANDEVQFDASLRKKLDTVFGTASE